MGMTYASMSIYRQVFKALGLLEHLIKHGTELVVEDSRDRVK